MAEAFEEGPYVYGVMPGTVWWGAPEGWCGGLFDDLPAGTTLPSQINHKPEEQAMSMQSRESKLAELLGNTLMNAELARELTSDQIAGQKMEIERLRDSNVEMDKLKVRIEDLESQCRAKDGQMASLRERVGVLGPKADYADLKAPVVIAAEHGMMVSRAAGVIVQAVTAEIRKELYLKPKSRKAHGLAPTPRRKRIEDLLARLVMAGGDLHGLCEKEIPMNAEGVALIQEATGIIRDLGISGIGPLRKTGK